MEGARMIFLIVVMAIAAVTDIKNRMIPNRLIIPSIVVALVLQIFANNWINIVLAIVGFVFLGLLYTANTNFIGGGDIKLIIFTIMILGPAFKEYIYLFAIYTILVLIIYFIKEKITKEKQVLPLALSMLMASVTQIVLGLY